MPSNETPTKKDFTMTLREKIVGTVVASTTTAAWLVKNTIKPYDPSK